MTPRDEGSATIEGVLRAADLPALLAHPDVELVTLVEVIGARRARIQEAAERWYSVFARFVIQIEGCTSGSQTFEERVVLMMAKDEEEARRRFHVYARNEARPYLNEDGEFVRWHMESILDVQDAMVDAFEPNGTEVYSKLRRRRLTAERAWRPSGGQRLP